MKEYAIAGFSTICSLVAIACAIDAWRMARQTKKILEKAEEKQ